MFEVALAGGPTADRAGAGRVPHVSKVPEFDAGIVAPAFVPVIAVASGEGIQELGGVGNELGLVPGDRPVQQRGQDFAARETWMEEHADQLWDFRAQRLPDVKGLVVTADAPDAADRGPTGTLKLTGISLLDPEQDEIARGLTPGDGPSPTRGPGDAGRADHRGHRGQPFGEHPLGAGPRP